MVYYPHPLIRPPFLPLSCKCSGFLSEPAGTAPYRGEGSGPVPLTFTRVPLLTCPTASQPSGQELRAVSWGPREQRRRPPAPVGATRRLVLAAPDDNPPRAERWLLQGHQGGEARAAGPQDRLSGGRS